MIPPNLTDEATSQGQSIEVRSESTGRVLAVDPGKARVGIALSDELRVLASPLTVLDGSDRLRVVANVLKLVREHEVKRVLVGLPLHMSGSAGAAAGRATDLAQRIADATGLEVELVDERLTTVEATRKSREARGTKRRDKAETIDDKAACVLLQSWLDRPRPREV